MPFDALGSVARVVVEALFNGLWQGIALCLFVGCALACHRHANAATRYAIWCLTLIAIACLPLVRAKVPRRPVVSRITIVEEPARPVVRHRVTPVRTVTPAPLPPHIDTGAIAPLATVHLRNRWQVILFGLWVAGALLMLARLLWSYLHVRRLRRDSIPLQGPYQDRLSEWLCVSGGSRRVKLHSTPEIATPMSLGPLNPLILMPESFLGRLTEKESDQVLLHELAHIRRGDNWTNLFQKLVEALLFFHPAVWWTAKRLNLERESACDDWVVHITGEPRPYAACLAKLVEVATPVPQPLLATGIFRGAKQITTRIERLLDSRRNRAPRASWITVAPAVLMLAAAALVCSEVRTVLAGPVVNRPFAHLQPVAWSGQEPTPQPDVQPRSPKPKARALTDQLHELMEQVESLQSPGNEYQMLREKLDAGVEDARKQLQQDGEFQLPQGKNLENLNQSLELLQHNGMAQLLREDSLKDLDHQLLASEEALRRVQQEFNFQESNGWWNGLNVRTKGQVEFTDDDSDVKSVSPGGYVSIEERRGWTTRKYEVTPTERRYLVNGSSHPIDNEAKAWLAEVLPQVIRDSAVGADARVKRILKQHGPAGILDEIARISSDHAKRVYFNELFANGPLQPDVLRGAARQIGREISSDGEKARLLMEAADTYLKDPSPARVEFFDAVGTIASDGEHRRVLSSVLQKDGRNKETLLLCLKSAARISSDGEKARLLTEAADAFAFNSSLAPQFLDAVNALASDGEHARVLMSLMRLNGLTKDTMVLLMKSIARIASDGEKSHVLMRASEFYTSDPGLRTAFFNATATIASDGEHSRVLLSLLARSGLDKESFIEIIRSAEHIASDGEKGRVLRQVAAICPNDDSIVGALVQAVQTITSDGEYRRVMSAMLNRSDLSTKITRIKFI